jgi:hypothetical protein
MTNERSNTNSWTDREKQRWYLKAVKAQSCPCLEGLRKTNKNLGLDNHSRQHYAGKLTTTPEKFGDVQEHLYLSQHRFGCTDSRSSRMYQSNPTSHVTQIDLYFIKSDTRSHKDRSFEKLFYVANIQRNRPMGNLSSDYILLTERSAL